ncbi:carboxymuconolactone decarboxylase family protein [Kribbella sandramycini]|uniref:AhpD family alkylhydroperoxidase n=1 Tax=Kribbella sandramycini TaxID=60450 RepID=A0A7Y4NZY3_9ACTN|nr:carboxymuconolactone decarboxylase family protein [Kribbella sandramycini]MBB6565817.1 AhpD family alkylhydroperoxidase [Kribbella sandramycini]NOL42081.1 carboxymuconolactone decarboxylase family protein [Kribbella sandramycini]
MRINLMETELGAKLGKRFAGLAMVVEQANLPASVKELVNIRASQINGCGFCLDMHTKDATAAGEDIQRLHLVAAWREATVYTPAERAALALAEEGTRLADTHAGVSDATWAAVREHFDEEQAAALIMQVALINAANRMNVIAQTPAGSYQPGMFHQLVNQ